MLSKDTQFLYGLLSEYIILKAMNWDSPGIENFPYGEYFLNLKFCRSRNTGAGL